MRRRKAPGTTQKGLFSLQATTNTLRMSGRAISTAQDAPLICRYAALYVVGIASALAARAAVLRFLKEQTRSVDVFWRKAQTLYLNICRKKSSPRTWIHGTGKPWQFIGSFVRS
jgi:hypothetical protein